jgi:hypothetical protein
MIRLAFALLLFTIRVLIAGFSNDGKDLVARAVGGDTFSARPGRQRRPRQPRP